MIQIKIINSIDEKVYENTFYDLNSQNVTHDTFYKLNKKLKKDYQNLKEEIVNSYTKNINSDFLNSSKKYQKHQIPLDLSNLKTFHFQVYFLETKSHFQIQFSDLESNCNKKNCKQFTLSNKNLDLFYDYFISVPKEWELNKNFSKINFSLLSELLILQPIFSNLYKNFPTKLIKIINSFSKSIILNSFHSFPNFTNEKLFLQRLENEKQLIKNFILNKEENLEFNIDKFITKEEKEFLTFDEISFFKQSIIKIFNQKSYTLYEYWKILNLFQNYPELLKVHYEIFSEHFLNLNLKLNFDNYVEKFKKVFVK